MGSLLINTGDDLTDVYKRQDVALDDSWNYTDILWNVIQAEKVQRAFEKLNYREQTLLEKRLAIDVYKRQV